MKRCVVLVIKMRFLPPFCFNLASEVCTGVCRDPTSLVKFRPNRFRFARVIPEKVISYDRNMHIMTVNEVKG